jgi:hypothetical protein
MDNINLIRSGIFLVAGLICIIFRVRLNNFKNNVLKKLNLKKWVKNEEKNYLPLGIIFIIISIALFIYSINN